MINIFYWHYKYRTTRDLDPDKRSQLGAHYTDPQSIMRIVEPVVLAPLRSAWLVVKAELDKSLAKPTKAKLKAAGAKLAAFLHELRSVRVLDPACGSGNFLYLALQGLKDLEHQVLVEAEALGLPKQFPDVSPRQFLGIELNPYAAELARVTIWIGHIQWMLQHGFNIKRDPVLERLDTIECRDALLTESGAWAKWPEADFVVGNPPFLGDKRMLSELGEDYVGALRSAYKGKVLGGADLVTYWFVRAGEQLKAGKLRAAGLVSTNSIRGGANRKTFEYALEGSKVFNAWGDEAWVNEGAAVRVSLVCFGGYQGWVDWAWSSVASWFGEGAAAESVFLNGKAVSEIYSDLTAPSGNESLDLTKTKQLAENKSIAFQGVTKVGDFQITGELAREWLLLPKNPNQRNNSDVIKPWFNGLDITNRQRDMWIIDFGVNMPEEEACLYEKPFEHIVEHVKPMRDKHQKKSNRIFWWIYEAPRPALRKAISGLTRYIATPRVAKHRLFVWVEQTILPDTRMYIIAREDDTTFGILHSRIHEVWSLGTCSWHGVGNDPTYNAHSVFETFPFPEGLTPDIPASDYATDPRAQAIADAAKTLD